MYSLNGIAEGHYGNKGVTYMEAANSLDTVERIIFEDKKFRGFRGYLVNLENKYPRNFLYIRLDSSFNT